MKLYGDLALFLVSPYDIFLLSVSQLVEDKLRRGTRLDVSTGLFWSGDESVLVAELKGLVKNVNSALLWWGVSEDKGGGVGQAKVTDREKYQSQG